MNKAACAYVDPELFFPSTTWEAQQAKRICGSCPLRGECLRYALDNREEYGIWGGTAPRQRAKLLRRAA